MTEPIESGQRVDSQHLLGLMGMDESGPADPGLQTPVAAEPEAPSPSAAPPQALEPLVFDEPAAEALTPGRPEGFTDEDWAAQQQFEASEYEDEDDLDGEPVTSAPDTALYERLAVLEDRQARQIDEPPPAPAEEAEPIDFTSPEMVNALTEGLELDDTQKEAFARKMQVVEKVRFDRTQTAIRTAVEPIEQASLESNEALQLQQAGVMIRENLETAVVHAEIHGSPGERAVARDFRENGHDSKLMAVLGSKRHLLADSEGVWIALGAAANDVSTAAPVLENSDTGVRGRADLPIATGDQGFTAEQQIMDELHQINSGNVLDRLFPG